MNGNKIKILIVDDDDANRNTYAEVFKQAGFEVSEAVDGVEGLDKATKIIPDVIFTGIIMPRMDGFGLKEALTKNIATTNIPVMMLSHMGREEDKRKAEELGVKDFIIQGMTTPRQTIEKVKAMFDSGDYTLKFNPNELDAPKLATDFHFLPGFKCPNCSKEMVLTMKISNIDKHEFKAKFVCPNCE